MDEGAPRKIRVWGSSDRMEGSGARQAADVKLILKSLTVKKKKTPLLGLGLRVRVKG